MAEYIEKEAAFNAVLKLVPKVDGDGYCWVIRGDVAMAVDSVPAADVVPVRHGRWMLKTFDDGYGEYQLYECDQCGAHTAQKCRNFCHNCGAKMDGEA